MPRRRPGAIRAEQPSNPEWGYRPPDRIPGLSAQTSLEILRVQKRVGLYVDSALRRYQEFLSPPRRWPLYPVPEDCPCPGCSLDDVRNARQELEDALRELPPRARGELRRRVQVLDEDYRRRTLPDLWSDEENWWRRRLTVD